MKRHYFNNKKYTDQMNIQHLLFKIALNMLDNQTNEKKNNKTKTLDTIQNPFSAKISVS